MSNQSLFPQRHWRQMTLELFLNENCLIKQFRFKFDPKEMFKNSKRRKTLLLAPANIFDWIQTTLAISSGIQFAKECKTKDRSQNSKLNSKMKMRQEAKENFYWKSLKSSLHFSIEAVELARSFHWANILPLKRFKLLRFSVLGGRRKKGLMLSN